MKHTCHLPPCKKVCLSRHLFCREHWAMVPTELQKAVYDTVGKRGKCVDASWVPWWRAQAAATVFVLRITHPSYKDRIDKLEKREADFADKLLRKDES